MAARGKGDEDREGENERERSGIGQRRGRARGLLSWRREGGIEMERSAVQELGFGPSRSGREV